MDINGFFFGVVFVFIVLFFFFFFFPCFFRCLLSFLLLLLLAVWMAPSVQVSARANHNLCLIHWIWASPILCEASSPPFPPPVDAPRDMQLSCIYNGFLRTLCFISSTSGAQWGRQGHCPSPQG